MIIKLVEEYCLNLLFEKSPKVNVYHTVEHTKEVVASAIEIATAENTTPEELELVTVAAWFHDTGYLNKTAGHEELSVMYASNFLSTNNYEQAKIEIILGCILATKVPQYPKTKLQQIMCDADLSHLGRKCFEQRNNLFRAEFEHYFGRKLTESEWLLKSLEFISHHNFFTAYSIKTFTPIQLENISLLQNQLSSLSL